MPAAGRDYPGTWQAFEAWFPDDDACVAFLEQLRWPDGFVCPACGHQGAWRTAGGLWMCQDCGRKTSVTAGTIFHRSRLPLRTWFAAMWFVCAQKNGVSALGLQRVLGFGSYQTAWAWLHKLRRAMVRPDRELLGGPGRVGRDGRTPTGAATRHTAPLRQQGRSRHRRRAAPSHRVRASRMSHIDSRQRKAEIFDFAKANIAPGTILYTDGDPLYNDLHRQLDITHEPLVVVSSTEEAHQLLPGIASRHCSSGGWPAPCTTATPPPTSTTTSTSSPSGSTVAPRAVAACCGTGSSSKPSPPTPTPTTSSPPPASTTRYGGNCTQVDSPYTSSTHEWSHPARLRRRSNVTGPDRHRDAAQRAVLAASTSAKV